MRHIWTQTLITVKVFGVGRKAQAAPGEYALAVSSAVRKHLGDIRMSNRRLAVIADLSEPYLRDRLNDVYPFTLNDVEAIARAFEWDTAEFLEEVLAPKAKVTPIRDVSTLTDDELARLDTAAGSDATTPSE